MNKENRPKAVGVVSYNIHCNFTNYGSALQSWALCQSIDRLGSGACRSILVDYCPDILADADPLHPLERMWDQDAESRQMCEWSLPAIRENYGKLDRFYTANFHRTVKKYTSGNFQDIAQESVNCFLCGSDTIFCPDEFGFDRGYYADFPIMRERSAAYAASFGDPHFRTEDYPRLNCLLQNFTAIALRERSMLDYVRERVAVPVEQVLDPSLLLTAADYDVLAESRQLDGPYLLLYARRYNSVMETYAERIAKEHEWAIVEISLRAGNAQKGHNMRYDAGVEEFLSLVKYAECIVTNSYHGMIFAMHYRRPFSIFLREQGNKKITELLRILELENRFTGSAEEPLCVVREADYDRLHIIIAHERARSLLFLQSELARLDTSVKRSSGGKSNVP